MAMKPRWQARIAARAAIVMLIVAVAWFAHEQLLKEDPRDRRIAQRIRLLDAPKPPPPPPPRTKIEEKPVEMKQEREVEVRSEAQNPNPTPGDRLGLDAAGSGGGDAFGLAARPGGRDITIIGPESPTIGTAKAAGGDGIRWAWYGGVVKQHFEEIARSDKRLQGQVFQVVLHIWVAPDGGVAKYALLGSTGDDAIDRVLRDLLAGAPPMREPPPQDMPQPVRLRLTSRIPG